jgi:hypothetical protein
MARLDDRFDEALRSFESEVELSASVQAADPQLVLVFEALDERIDLMQVAQDLGFEILSETERSFEPTEEFALISDNPRDPMIGACLHAVCLNQRALDRLLLLWRNWRRTRTVERGYSALRELFVHLRDIRPWGPQDRLKMIDWQDYFGGQITDGLHAIEIELWYRRTANTRVEAQRAVTSLVELAGGSVPSSATVDQIGYHGLRCLVPASMLLDLAQARFDQVQLVRSANVMYLRITGQSLLPAAPNTDVDVVIGDVPLPELPPAPGCCPHASSG